MSRETRVIDLSDGSNLVGTEEECRAVQANEQAQAMSVAKLAARIRQATGISGRAALEAAKAEMHGYGGGAENYLVEIGLDTLIATEAQG